MLNQNIYIVEAKRTATGNFNGSLANIAAHKLGEIVIRDLMHNEYMQNQEISQLIMGQVLTAGSGQNPARQALINSSISYKVPAWTLNQVCGSGLRAVIEGVKSIACGESEIIIAGGQENMSSSGHLVYMRQGVKMGEAKLIDTMIIDGLTDAFNHYHMGITAENIVRKFAISREEQDKFSYNSHIKATEAQKQNKFKNQIVPIEIDHKKIKMIFDKDESIRENSTLESLASLKPVFEKTGTVTAGNSSGINDGAAAVILMSEKKINSLGIKPLARIKSWASVGVEPELMGTGPIPTVEKALKLAGWQINELDLIESNEAFAAQSLAVNKLLGWDVSKVNVNGGAIALGHPIGASGARILVTLLHEMQIKDAKKALATLCIGGGMGIAICLER